MTAALCVASKARSWRLFIGKPNILGVLPLCNSLPLSEYNMFGTFASSSSLGVKASSPIHFGLGATEPSFAANEWRKQQLDKIEHKFKGKKLKALSIESEEDLQPMWKEMEGRVTRRKPRSLGDTGGKSGRMNIKKTEEDMWLEEGLYSTDEDDNSKKK